MKNFVVLGANSDIGRTLVADLASRPGLSVIAVARSAITGAEVPGVVRLDECDLLNLVSLGRLRDTIGEAFTSPFAVVHSVGDFWEHRPLDETLPETARAQIESHYLTLYNVAHFIIPLMIERGGGQLLAFSCNSVLHHYPEMAPFTSAKAAVETLIRCIANEYSGQGVQANYIALPTIHTEKVINTKSLEDAASYVSPKELASLVIDNVLTLPPIVSGTGLKVFRHNANFYGTGYFSRNPSGRKGKLKKPPA
jgi:NAD(P)-dependent dehydrogenase (short-subunit alcohol dehydrogenase family)